MLKIIALKLIAILMMIAAFLVMWLPNGATGHLYLFWVSLAIFIAGMYLFQKAKNYEIEREL